MSEWEKLLNKKVDEVVKAIQEENAELSVQKVPVDSMVTQDYNVNRVRVFYNADNIVVRVPQLG